MPKNEGRDYLRNIKRETVEIEKMSCRSRALSIG